MQGVHATGCWVGSDFWQPHHEVTSVMSYPQQPCSAPVDARLRLIVWNRSIHILASSFPATFYFSQHYCPFRRSSLPHDVPSAYALCRGLFVCLFSYYSLFIILTITLENTCLFTLSPWSQWPFTWITVGDARPSPWFDFCLLWSLLHGAEELSLKVPVQTLAMAHTLQGSHLSQIKTIVLHWLLRSLWSLSPHFPYPSSWLGSSPMGLLDDP